MREALVLELERQVETMREATRATREGATHEESRAENDKDTRGLEASYLARGQAQRVVELENDLTIMRALSALPFAPDSPIGEGALLRVEVDGEARLFLFVRRAGGLRVRVGELEVQVLSPSSPVGGALVGRLEGEEIELRVGGSLREYYIDRVR